MDCVLKLNNLVFDEISFKRIAVIQSKYDLEISFSVDIGINTSNSDIKKVSVKIIGNKKEEYIFEIQASGYFSYEGNVEDTIITQNAVAIVMPYIRSEVSLLTAQPGIEPVVIPPFNVVEMMKENNQK